MLRVFLSSWLLVSLGEHWTPLVSRKYLLIWGQSLPLLLPLNKHNNGRGLGER